MPPSMTHAQRKAAPLFDPDPGTIHIKDMFHRKDLQTQRCSDQVFGMLLTATWYQIITKTAAVKFCQLFINGVKTRKYRVHEGKPWLGPDGLVVVYEGIPYNGADNSLIASPLEPVDFAVHPNFNHWISTFLYAGKAADDHGPIPANAVAAKGKGKGSVPGSTQSQFIVSPRVPDNSDFASPVSLTRRALSPLERSPTPSPPAPPRFVFAFWASLVLLLASMMDWFKWWK